MDINYEPGAHICQPFGMIRNGEQPQYLVLHYKYLGADYVIVRTKQYRSRMSDENIEKGYALQYLEEEDIIKMNINTKLHNAQVVIE